MRPKKDGSKKRVSTVLRRDAVFDPGDRWTLTRNADGRPAYNGMVASTRLQKYWPKITRAYRNKQESIIWMIACSKKDCSGELRLKLARSEGYSTCEKCRWPKGKGHYSKFVNKNAVIVATRIRKGGTKHHLCACQNAGCSGTFWYGSYKKGRRQCLDCDYQNVKFNGHPVRNEKLRAAYDKIASVTKSPDGTLTFILRCETLGCDGVFSANSYLYGDNTRCISCIRKNRPYENQWRRLIGKRASEIRQDIPLTYDQFAKLCRLPNCFYCLSPLLRSRHSGDPGSLAIYLDRVDSKGTYIAGNVVPCCGRCNKVKGAWLSGHDFLAIVAIRIKDRVALGYAETKKKFTWGLIQQRCNQSRKKGTSRTLWEVST
jgi:hypothetical protein